MEAAKEPRESPLACRLEPFSGEQRERWQELGARWRSVVQEVRELADGYALRLPPDATTIRDAAEWMTLDRLCCPFFTFTLRIEREGGAVWLELTGREGVKDFLREAMARARA